MKTKAIVYQYNIENRDKELVKKILNAADIIEYELINAQFYDLKFDKTVDLYICFGTRATLQANYVSKNIVIFPELINLFDVPSNEKTRQKAFELVELVKSKQEASKLISTQTLKHSTIDLTIDDLRKLKQVADEKNLSSIKLFNKSGKPINIFFSDKEDIDKDSILFEELLAIQLAMNIFNIESWKRNNNDE